MNYDDVKKVWENKDVHGDLNKKTLKFYSEEISKLLALSDQDTVLDIGCGDGRVDEFLIPEVSRLSGFDFSENKIKDAIKRSPAGQYWVQSFLDPVPEEKFNKVFSFSVMQYCKPKDIEIFVRNSVKCCLQGGKIVHVDVPDRRKITNFYLKNGGFLKKLKGLIKSALALSNPEYLLFDDGSYWVDMVKAQEIVKKLGYRSEIKDSWNEYRSHFTIYR